MLAECNKSYETELMITEGSKALFQCWFNLSSLPDHSKGFGGKFGVQKERVDKVCMENESGILLLFYLYCVILRHEKVDLIPEEIRKNSPFIFSLRN